MHVCIAISTFPHPPAQAFPVEGALFASGCLLNQVVSSPLFPSRPYTLRQLTAFAEAEGRDQVLPSQASEATEAVFPRQGAVGQHPYRGGGV